MRFCEALDDLQTMQDFRVRRSGWPLNDYLEAPDDQLVKHTPSVGGTATITSLWTPTQDDLFADDWHEVGTSEEVDASQPVKADVLPFRPSTIEEALWPSSQSHRG